MRRLSILLAILLAAVPAWGGTAIYQLNSKGGSTTPLRYFICDTLADRAALTGLQEGERCYLKDLNLSSRYNGTTWLDREFKIYLTADETCTSDQTINTSPTLQFAAAASTEYLIHIELHGTYTSAVGFQWRLTTPGSPTLTRVHYKDMGPTATSWTHVNVQPANNTYVVNSPVATGNFFVEGWAIVHNGSNAGTISIDWSQASSNVATTTLSKGSYISYTVVG